MREERRERREDGRGNEDDGVVHIHALEAESMVREVGREIGRQQTCKHLNCFPDFDLPNLSAIPIPLSLSLLPFHLLLLSSSLFFPLPHSVSC